VEQVWGTALGSRSSFEWGAPLGSSFRPQLWGAAFGSNFGEQLSGAALENSFGERFGEQV